MIFSTDYRAHEVFVAPARKSPALWRLAVGLVLAVVGYLALSQMYFQMIYGFAADQAQSLFAQLDAGSTPVAMYLLLFSFAAMMMSVAVTVRVLHGRSFRSLLGPLPLFWRDFRAVLIVVLGLSVIIAILPPWDMGAPYVPNMAFGPWMTLLPLSLIAVFVQVTAEEVVFRGYLQQQLAARFRSPFIWMVLPSALFALGHYLPDTAGENAILITVWAGFFGILMADLTARSGSLGPAVAVHFCNNVFAHHAAMIQSNVAAVLTEAFETYLNWNVYYHEG